MRSTHARMLHNGQLLVDRSAVSRITAEPHRVPHNTASVVLINRRTGEQSTRNLRWDKQVTTEEPLEVKIGETGKLRVELALPADDDGRPTYRWHLTDDSAGIDAPGIDLQSLWPQGLQSRIVIIAASKSLHLPVLAAAWTLRGHRRQSGHKSESSSRAVRKS